ncbi:relaxase/mobilization nuclease domain-containing protein [Wenyingzhuangia sp. 2_MG-2023]|uniref:relaxase/mobilization nuclease domain-containing protein n=1 Tax=Wenyingzhuangia sp. 2_MG-2023 TaxID=3062639 RepID=UPI0026E3057A|nr:relaxase/mobilization nuclease domain-containing protein [Wenyingzhuangia sp. 2_MG-2023]MDO6737386.1 relaxase/mobilization nuclease domain-containing protein [Wenyingzhuangia sp. 2_MG-2023]
MIAKGTCLSNTKAALLYGDDINKDAKIIFSNYLHSQKPSEIAKEFKLFQDQNTYCKKNTFSFIISPTIEDGKKMNEADLKKMCKLFLKELKLDEHQAVGYVHRDKEHLHAHLYVNRVNFSGEAFDAWRIGKRAQLAAKNVALQMGLTTVEQVKEQKQENTKLIRGEIKSIHDSMMKQRPKSLKDYIKKMKNNNVIVKPVINKQNKLQGFRYEYKKHSFKGSEVHRDMSINKLNFEIPKEQKKELSNNKGLFNYNNLLFDYSGEYEPNRNKKRKNRWRR